MLMRPPAARHYCYRSFIGWLLLSVIAFTLYSTGLESGFLYDDSHTVQDNPHLDMQCICLSEMLTAMYSFIGGGRELSMLSFALNQYILGHDPASYKLVNIFLHITTAGILLLLMGKIIELIKGLGATESRWKFLPWFVTVGWILHPLNVTSVLYISQRMTVLSTLFILIGLLLYLHGRSRMISGGRGWLLIAIAFVICGVLAFYSKQNGVLLYPLLLIIEIFVFKFKNRQQKIDQRICLLFFIFLGIPLLMLIGVLVVKPELLLGAYEYRPFTLFERLLTQSRVLIFYLGNLLVPRVQTMGMWHDNFIISTSLFDPIDTLISVIGITCLGLLPLLLWKRATLVAFGIAWFLVAHSLESTIFPLELVHEHRNYLAGIGIMIVLGSVIIKIPGINKKLAAVLLLSILLYFAVSLEKRIYQWRSPASLYWASYQNNPLSVYATFKLAVHYQKLAALGNEQYFEVAEQLTRRAAELDSYSILSEISLLIFQSATDQPYDPKLFLQAADKIRAYPGPASTGAALKGLRRCHMDRKCNMNEIHLRPFFEAVAESSRSETKTEAGIYFMDNGPQERGLRIFRELAEANPDRFQERANYISGLISVGLIEEAKLKFELLKTFDKRSLLINRDKLQRIEASLK
ncbi:MAG: hypothetical protein ACI9FD_001470 [Gammaproteobacteria bacterium]|jgi:hypothetical protein